MLIAHYDSVIGSPGANDNASGLAALLVLAQLAQQQRFARTLRFVAFVNEEPPYFLTRHMGSRVYARESAQRGERIVAMLSLFCTLLLLPGALLHWRDPTLEEVLWLSLTAVVATTGHYTLTRAFAAAPLTVTQPLGFLQLVWATVLGVTLFGEALDPFVLLGGGIVVAAASYISHREAAAARRMRTPPAVATKT